MQRHCIHLIGTDAVEQQENNKKEKGVRFSPCVLHMALAIYTQSKVGYEELRKSSIDVMPSASTLACIKSKMQTTDGICPKTYQWFYDNTVCQIPDQDRAGHLMCDKMQLKSGIYWNTANHKLSRFASDLDELDLAKEIQSLNELCDDKKGDATANTGSDASLKTDNVTAKKVNQWCFCSIKGVIHNAEFFFNSGSLTRDELLCQFIHVVSCY